MSTSRPNILFLHDLLADWDRLQSGQLPFKIDPLR